MTAGGVELRPAADSAGAAGAWPHRRVPHVSCGTRPVDATRPSAGCAGAVWLRKSSRHVAWPGAACADPGDVAWPWAGGFVLGRARKAGRLPRPNGTPHQVPDRVRRIAERLLLLCEAVLKLRAGTPIARNFVFRHRRCRHSCRRINNVRSHKSRAALTNERCREADAHPAPPRCLACQCAAPLGMPMRSRSYARGHPCSHGSPRSRSSASRRSRHCVPCSSFLRARAMPSRHVPGSRMPKHLPFLCSHVVRSACQTCIAQLKTARSPVVAVGRRTSAPRLLSCGRNPPTAFLKNSSRKSVVAPPRRAPLWPRSGQRWSTSGQVLVDVGQFGPKRLDIGTLWAETGPNVVGAGPMLGRWSNRPALQKHRRPSFRKVSLSNAA